MHREVCKGLRSLKVQHSGGRSQIKGWNPRVSKMGLQGSAQVEKCAALSCDKTRAEAGPWAGLGPGAGGQGQGCMCL